jgi:hypothetical protein
MTDAEVGKTRPRGQYWTQLILCQGSDHNTHRAIHVHKLGPWYAIGTLQIVATKMGFVVFGMSMNTEAR